MSREPPKILGEDENFTYFNGYKVPKHYTIPPDYALPNASEVTATSTVGGTPSGTESQKGFNIDPTTAAITAGMIGLFGGVAIGRVSKRKSSKV